MPTHESPANRARFTGFADHYDRYRPSPPAGLAELIAQYTGTTRPTLVVDLGSGTGLSTRYWADRAVQVVGVEPTPDMRRQAEAATTAANISYRAGFAGVTGLPTRCAQVVICVSSLNWMDPAVIFGEAARLLVPGGVFVACDYDWPPQSGSEEADAAFSDCIHTARRLEEDRQVSAGLRHWDKAGHFKRMQASGVFREVHDVGIPHRDTGNSERLVSLLLSLSFVMALRRAGVSDEELGLPALRSVAERTLGSSPRSFLWQAHVRIGLV